MWVIVEQVISPHPLFAHCFYANLLTVNGWAGFLSRISQDSRTEFFMAAFTLKLVAKTKEQKTNKHEYGSSLI